MPKSPKKTPHLQYKLNQIAIFFFSFLIPEKIEKLQDNTWFYQNNGKFCFCFTRDPKQNNTTVPFSRSACRHILGRFWRKISVLRTSSLNFRHINWHIIKYLSYYKLIYYSVLNILSHQTMLPSHMYRFLSSFLTLTNSSAM